MARQWRCTVFGRPIAPWRDTKREALLDADEAGERFPPEKLGAPAYMTPWTRILQRDLDD